MKKVGAAVVLVGALVGGYYYGAPYLALNDLRQAVADKDSEVLKELIDFPSVRQSLKDQFNVILASKMAAEAKDNPFAAIGVGFASSMVDGMVDGLVTPAAMTKMLSSVTEKNSQSGAKSSEGNENTMSYGGSEYSSLDKFLIKTRNEKGEELTVTMRRTGFAAWKITDVQLPPDALGDKPSSK